MEPAGVAQREFAEVINGAREGGFAEVFAGIGGSVRHSAAIGGAFVAPRFT
jgi:hypothetical protein